MSQAGSGIAPPTLATEPVPNSEERKDPTSKEAIELINKERNRVKYQNGEGRWLTG